MFFFFNDTATTEIYTLSLHDALPIYNIAAAIRGGSPKPFSFGGLGMFCLVGHGAGVGETKFGIKLKGRLGWFMGDRKSPRLNSSHANISYAVFCFQKKKIYSIPASTG